MQMVFGLVMSFMKSLLLRKCMCTLETEALVAMWVGLMK